MIYLGGKWPAKYRDQIFMNNIHGQRINVDLLDPQRLRLRRRPRRRTSCSPTIAGRRF